MITHLCNTCANDSETCIGLRTLVENNVVECDCYVDEPQEWFFTFPQRLPTKNNYVVIKGSYAEARGKMFEKYGQEWAVQYDSATAAGVERFGLQLLEVL